MDYLKCPFLLPYIIKMKKEFSNLLEQAQTECNNYEFDNCLNTLQELQYKTDNYEILQDIIDEETATEMAKHELEEGGLARLYYFLWNVNFATETVYRIDWYWNLDEVKQDDLQCYIDEFKDYIEEN